MGKVKVDADLIFKVARNARLNISEKEAREFVPQIQDVLDSFSSLDKLDVSKAKPSFHPIEMKNVMREDRKGSCLAQEDALSNTHHRKKGYFKGPKIV